MTLLAERSDVSAPTMTPPRASLPDQGKHFEHLWTVAAVLSMGLGLVSLWIADVTSRDGSNFPNASALFWIGLLLIIGPVAARVLSRDVDRKERILLIVALGLALYLAKVLRSPSAFTFGDEYVHLRNTQDILRTHHLFSFNPLLNTAAYYPGLGAVTAGMVRLTGLSVFASGLVLMGVPRCLLSVCIFLVAERVTGSDRTAAGASLVYAANPMYLFWAASFTYENLALPLAAFVIWWIGRTRRDVGRPALAAGVIAIAAVVVTHHVAAFGLSALLGAWWLIERVMQKPSAARRDLGLVVIVSSAATLVWFLAVARPAFSYLVTQNLSPGLRQTGSLIAGNTAPRKLYSSGGYVSPAWQRFAGFAGLGVILLVIPPGLYLAWRQRTRAPMVIAMAVTVAFPLSLIPRLTPIGIAISGRSSEFIFAGLGCVLGLLVSVEFWPRRHQHSVPKLRTRLAGWAAAPHWLLG